MVSQKISKEVFVQVIENLRQQYLQDKEYVEGISSVFGIDMPLYDNSHLLKSSLELLRVFFPKDENGFCDIEFYCYVCEFGKIGEVKDASELYDRLISEQIEKANKKYDLERQNCECKSKEKQCMFCYMHGLNTPTFDLSGVVEERVKPE